MRLRPGFTLIELLAALLLLDGALLALAGNAAMLTRVAGVARRRALAVDAAAATIERLRTLDCPAPAQGRNTVAPGIVESWSVSPGPGSTRRLSDSVAFPGLSGPAAYVLRSAATC